MADTRPPWRCATCKHWQDIWCMHPYPITEGGCALTLAESVPEAQCTWDEKFPDSKAHAMWFLPDTDEFHRVMLATKPDFGCNQWEEAP